MNDAMFVAMDLTGSMPVTELIEVLEGCGRVGASEWAFDACTSHLRPSLISSGQASSGREGDVATACLL